ncbi:hypothetical protein NKH77_39630 [Streptomyces sp. M19]
MFEATHATLLRLIGEGVIEGLRIDHPDGLADPRGTCGGWTGRYGPPRAAAGGRSWRRSSAGTNGCPPTGRSPGPPATTRSSGSTGCSSTRGARRTDRRLPRLHRGRAGARRRLGRDRAPRGVGGGHLRPHGRGGATDARGLADLRHLPRLRDHAPWTLRTAIRELLVRLPVYRPYVSADAPAPESDVAMLQEAARGAAGLSRCRRRRGPWTPCGTRRSRDWATGRTIATSARASPRPRPRCGPSRSRTGPSTGSRHCCRPPRWAASQAIQR